MIKTKIKIYVASSWRNAHQPKVVDELRSVGFEVYDFRHPKDGENGFSWDKIDPDWKNWTIAEYIENLTDPEANDGFLKDITAMSKSDVCVLVLPSGRSSHLEAGYFAMRSQKFLGIYIPEKIEPELMYSMANVVSDNLYEIVHKALNWEEEGMP